jgi:hypothetical protein
MRWWPIWRLEAIFVERGNTAVMLALVASIHVLNTA